MELVLALLLVLWFFGLLGGTVEVLLKVVGMVAAPAIILFLLTLWAATI